MKKRGVMFAFLLLLLLSPLIFADEYGAQTAAYDCVLAEVEGAKCNTVDSLEDQIFALWATKECRDQVLAKSSNDECWPRSSCTIKTTSQALIGLLDAGTNTDQIVDWLEQRKIAPDEIDWFVQVDANKQTQCTIETTTSVYAFTLNEDKTITGSSSGCFSPDGITSNNDYWLKIAQNCLDEEFTISCDESFATNLLYKETEDNVFYIAPTTNEAGADGRTLETINSFCFGSRSCDYEGTLWAALALDYSGEDITSYLPYIIANAKNDDYEDFLPEAFVYHLREYDEYYTSLIDKQRPQGYWSESGDKYYDTALALLPFGGQNFEEKTQAKEWLIDVQRESGCFGDSVDEIGNTALLLFSIWPDDSFTPDCYTKEDCTGSKDCVFGMCAPAGADCVKDRHCEDGFICDKEYKCVEAVDCVNDTDCDDPAQRCIGGYCTGGFFCDEENPCRIGYDCINERCVALDDGDDDPQIQDCLDEGLFCRSRSSCLLSEGTVKSGYECNSGLDICCSVGLVEETCTQKGGEICSAQQSCSGQTDNRASDLSSGEECCITGSCEENPYTNYCELYDGTCRSSCFSDETQSVESCPDPLAVCCKRSGSDSSGGDSQGGSTLWIWILLILIVAVILGFVFREKLQVWFMKLKSRFGTRGPTSRRGPPGFPPRSPPPMMRRPPMKRKILPPQQTRPAPRPSRPTPPRQKPSGELDDVLKKLKEIGK